jgi:hypothetical protein
MINDKPYIEWRLPVMLLTVSGVIFILLTAMFGVGVNKFTGAIEYHMSPGDDWAQPMINKEWEDDNIANAMQQFPGWLFWVMILGYYLAFAFMIYCYFQYLKWRWCNIPEYMLYKRRKKNV